jgi:hypothetical protein
METAKIFDYMVMVIACLFLSSGDFAWADRGSVSPWPVKISENSQRAIILHNSREEVLILGTELKAEKDTEGLEFIPFPSEPTVTPVIGNPFDEIEKLIFEKDISGLAWGGQEPGRGGGSEITPVPIEIKWSEKIGLHDVTVIKINDVYGFKEWVDLFFSKKGIPLTGDLHAFYNNAEDYVRRGIHYFVVDYVSIKTELRSVEPLLYRFKTEKIYYPLKTSTVVGGNGIVDLIFICPGSFPGQKLFDGFPIYPNFILGDSNGTTFDLSNSARVYPERIKAVYPEANEFFSKSKKLYIQVMRYAGPYNFKADFFFDIANLDPRTYAWDIMPGSRPWEDQNILKPVEDNEYQKMDTVKYLMNRSYHILMGDETATLKNGSYKSKPSPSNKDYLKVAIDQQTSGDLDGDGIHDAAVILHSSRLGSGAFFELTVLQGNSESFEQIDSISLGDRIKINALYIKNGIVNLDMMSHKEDDPSCCPSQKTKKQFKLKSSKLIEINE